MNNNVKITKFISVVLSVLLCGQFPATVFSQTVIGENTEFTASQAAILLEQTNEQSAATDSGSFVLPDSQTASVSGVLLTEIEDREPVGFNLERSGSVVRSGRIRKPVRVRALPKRVIPSQQPVVLEIENPGADLKILLTDVKGKPIKTMLYKHAEPDLLQVQLDPPQQFKPGRFVVTITDGDTVISQQDFRWGVLAINFDQAIYRPDEKVTLFLSVLDAVGATVCDSQMRVVITSPSGVQSVLSTENESIAKSADCGHLRADSDPDYVGTYQLGSEVGRYSVSLTSIRAESERTLEDFFIVDNTPPFRVSRNAPTRIYPPNYYSVEMTITAFKRWSGVIRDIVPESFSIKPSDTARSYSKKSIVPKQKNIHTRFIDLSYPFQGEHSILKRFGDVMEGEEALLYAKHSLQGHDGVDFSLPRNTPVLSADGGVVQKIDTKPYGNTVIVQHRWGKTYYGNLSQFLVKTGDTVVKGAVLGLSGETENGTEALHFGMKKTDHNFDNGYYGKIDPTPYFYGETLSAKENVQQLEWEISLTEGETVTIGYMFKAPLISPQFYLLGPLQLEPNTAEIPVLTQPDSTNASPSALFLDTTVATDSVEVLENADFFETDNILQKQILVAEFSEPRAWQIAADSLPTNQRVSTAEFFGGQYSGNGTTGQNSNTNQTFSSFSFQLAESQVQIEEAIIQFESQFAAYSDRGEYTGWEIAFDACTSSCTPDAWSGSGQITVSSTATLAHNESESMTVRLLADVSSEGTLASYTGEGTVLEGQIGYRLEESGNVNSIAQAKAKLILVYTYSTRSGRVTNTVVYPLESTNTGDSGTREAAQSGNCTRNSTCPVFDYNVDLAEDAVTDVSQWFKMEYFNDGNGSNDIVQNVNIQGTDVNSDDVRLEASRGSAQGNAQSAYFSGVSGYTPQTAQQLEVYHSTGTIYAVGGEVLQTYTAPANSLRKTKTVRYPIGVITNGSTTGKNSSSTTVYFPEQGVEVQKAWFRVVSTNVQSANYTLTTTTTVGSNPESSNYVYNLNAGGDVPLAAFTLFHVIPDSEYTELETADGITGVTVGLSTQANTTNLGGTSAELLITYSYASEYEGYVTTALTLAAQQTTNPSLTYSTTAGAVDPLLPELTGRKVVRGALLDSTVLTSDSDGNFPNGTLDIGSSISTGTCSVTADYDIKQDQMNSYSYWLENVTSAFTANDSDTYQVCFENDGNGDAGSMGGVHNAYLVYTYQVELPGLSQLMRHGKWFDSTGFRQAFTF